jgi:predicted O-methyltransferase YrrM
MNKYLKNIMDNQSIIKPDGEHIPLHSSVSLEEGLFIQQVIAKVQPKSSLEVGLAFGISAMLACSWRRR